MEERKQSKQPSIMSKVTTTWKDVREYLKANDLTRPQKTELLNYFNEQIQAFPLDDCIKLMPNGAVLANGRQLTLEERESFLIGAKALLNNQAFNIIADQITYQAMKKGLHDATEVDHLYFSKTALYFIDLFKKYLTSLDRLA